MIRILLALTLTAALAHATPPESYDKAKAAFDAGAMPKSPADLKGWFGGRWYEDAKPVRGTLVGIEGVPEKREDPASAEVLIMATWSDEDAAYWDALPADKLTRSQEMLRRGPRDGIIKFDASEKAAVITGLYDDGKYRYQYSLRLAGDALLMRYDYEHRRVTYGYFFRKIMDAAR